MRTLMPSLPQRVCIGLLTICAWSYPQGQTSAPVKQPPIIGADVSFLRQMEQGGAVFNDDGVPKPGLQILKDHGYTWVRLRLFNNPDKLPNDLAYTLASAKDAKALGFKLLLDFHFADDWADPAHQTTPKAWQKLAHAELQQAVFAYTRDTIQAFRTAGLMPDMVQIGNEITSGFLWPDGRLPEHWDRFAGLLSAGIQGVDAGRASAPRPRIMIHIDQGGNQETTRWFFDNLISRGIAFDVIGQSYYPWWQGSLDDLARNLRFMVKTYRKDIVIVETAYDWTAGEDFAQKKMPFPQTPAGQRQFLQALSKVVADTPDGRGIGIFWWEPMAPGAIARRALFDQDHRALEAVKVFDPQPAIQQAP